MAMAPSSADTKGALHAAEALLGAVVVPPVLSEDSMQVCQHSFDSTLATALSTLLRISSDSSLPSDSSHPSTPATVALPAAIDASIAALAPFA